MSILPIQTIGTQMVPKQNEEVEISIKLINGQFIKIKISLKETIEQLKEKIRKSQNLSETEDISLLLDGQILEDFSTLKKCKIHHETTLNQAATSNPKMTNKSMNFGVSLPDCEVIKELKIVQNGPDYCTFIPGLNLRGVCTNSKCEASKKKEYVWIKKGMGKFKIHKDAFTSKCSSCNEVVDSIDNLGFFDCVYGYRGLQIKPDRKEVEKNDQVAGDKIFTSFVKDDHMAHWATFTVTTRQRETSL